MTEQSIATPADEAPLMTSPRTKPRDGTDGKLLRAMIEKAGISQASALDLLNAAVPYRPISLRSLKGYLADVESKTFAPVPKWIMDCMPDVLAKYTESVKKPVKTKVIRASAASKSADTLTAKGAMKPVAKKAAVASAVPAKKPTSNRAKTATSKQTTPA